MATLADTYPAPRPKSLAPDNFERILAFAAIALLLVVLVALAKGHAQWGLLPWQVWAHLATVLTALALTPVMLLRRRGDRPHRALGTVWLVAMMATASISFEIRLSNRGGLGFIHILSAWTLIQVPIIWWSARTHNIARHRSAVRGMVLGALIIAGFFTLPFGRLLGTWLFG
ncbi:putative membrane protein [Sphingomonas sp. UYAg733]